MLECLLGVSIGWKEDTGIWGIWGLINKMVCPGVAIAHTSFFGWPGGMSPAAAVCPELWHTGVVTQRGTGQRGGGWKKNPNVWAVSVTAQWGNFQGRDLRGLTYLISLGLITPTLKLIYSQQMWVRFCGVYKGGRKGLKICLLGLCLKQLDV